MTKNNHFAYYEDEKPELDAIRDFHEQAEVKFKVDDNDGTAEKVVKHVGNIAIGVTEDVVPGAGAVTGAVASVRRVKTAYDLTASKWEASQSLIKVDEAKAIAQSPRLYFFEKVSEFFSWIGNAFTGIFSLFIPGVQGSKKIVNETSSIGSVSGKIVDAYLNKDSVSELFHSEYELLNQIEFTVIDQNKDGKIDRLELETAKELLDTNKDGEVTKEEMEARGFLGALLRIATYHKDSIDRNEYTERYGKLNLLHILGDSSAQVIGERFNELDMDNDGQVSRSEFRMALDGLDKDNNHRVTREEAGAYQDDANRAFDAMIAHQQRNGR